MLQHCDCFEMLSAVFFPFLCIRLLISNIYSFQPTRKTEFLNEQNKDAAIDDGSLRLLIVHSCTRQFLVA